MVKENANTEKKSSGIKTFLGGISALGILVGLVLLGNLTPTAEELAVDLLDTTESTAAITSFTPTEGNTGDFVYLTVENLENFSEDASGVFFGETLTEINLVEESVENPNEITIVVEVPELVEAGEYVIKIITPSEMVESETPFVFGSAVATDPLLGDLDELDEGLAVDMEMAEETSSKNEDAAVEETVVEESSEPKVTVDPPKNLSAISGPNGIELNWSGTGNNYRVYYSTQSGSYVHGVATRNLSANLAANLENGRLYFFAVSAVDSMGNESAMSNEVSAIYSAQIPEPSEQIFHASSDKPPQLSEEGPAETLAVSLLITFAASLFLFRKKIFAKAKA